jgi:hypothetical protein
MGILSGIQLLVIVSSFLLLTTGSDAWMAPSSSTGIPSATPTSSTTTQLWVRRSKKGTVGTLAKEGFLVDSPVPSQPKAAASQKEPSRNTSSSNSKSKKKKSSSENLALISPALAEWMKSNPQDQEDDGTKTTAATAMPSSSSLSAGATFQVFSDDDDEMASSARTKKGSSNPRRIKQSLRSQSELEQNIKVQTAVESLKEALQGTNNLQEILNSVKTLFELSYDPNASSPRVLFQGSSKTKQRFDYRLAWAGSDDAICHVGTGLHKVPLARLQEIFFSCLGGGSGNSGRRIEVLEVIRILGPFPNVRNTLQGTTKLEKVLVSNADSPTATTNGPVHNLQITMDSMIDGTGKEIMAGTADNIRRVPLHIYLADESVILAVVPPTNDNSSVREDPMEAKGAHVLVFLKEDNLKERLDSLRVS